MDLEPWILYLGGRAGGKIRCRRRLMMRFLFVFSLALTLVFAGCGSESETAESDIQSIPKDDVHGDVTGPPSGGMMDGLNTEMTVDPAIVEAWVGVMIHLVDSETGDAQIFEVQLGETVALGESGLTLGADVFIPDFVMDEGGIKSRSAETHNPAARVVISEEGMADYEGWLFAAMPEIHPFPHDRYQVLLMEGIPAE